MAWHFDGAGLNACRTWQELKAYLVREIPKLSDSVVFDDALAVLLYSASVRPSGHIHRIYVVPITDSTAFTVENPTYAREGVTLALDFWNNSPSDIGTVSFGTKFSLNGAFEKPGPGVHATYTFYCDGDGTWREVGRATQVVGRDPGNFPVADFSFVSNLLAVQFTDSSTDLVGIVNWSWDFGDTNVSSLQSPSHTYGAPGTYIVSLTVTNTVGNTDEFNRAVELASATNIAPTADFSVTKNFLVCQFTDLSTDSDGSIASWAWTFGDAGTSTLQHPSHTYLTAGTKTVTLTVTDDDGATDIVTVLVTVVAAGNALPIANWSYIATGLQVAFRDTSTDSDGAIASWLWNFGGANTSTKQNPTHTFGSAGSKTVSLQVTDNVGATDTLSRTITVAAAVTGMPYGPQGANAWDNNVTLSPNMGYFNLTQGGVSANSLVNHINAAKTLGMSLILEMTAGDHGNYMSVLTTSGGTNNQFDRRDWNLKMDTFNTSAIKTAIADAVADSARPVVAADVMDEPNVSGGGGDGNSWGPAGTMKKRGTSTYQIWNVVVSGNFSAGVTTINIISHPYDLFTGDRLVFLPGSGKTCVLTANRAAGSTTLAIAPLPKALNSGDAAHSNSVDNMAAHVKIFFPTLPVGATHKHNVFDSSNSYQVIDYITDQYSARFGDVTSFRNGGLSLGARDGHQICFAINVINGGDKIAGCPEPQTGGPGTGDSCNATPDQILDWGRILTNADGSGRRGVGLSQWNYYAPFYAESGNQGSFATLQSELAAKPRGAFSRP